MRTLASAEKQTLSATLEPLLGDKELKAHCIYGSQIAGYATDRSDYDVLIIAKNFRQRIKYYYLKGEVRCSALVVDSKSFEADCKKSSLGEFVSGRLLNCYETLSGGQYFLENETEFKRRVIIEGLEEAYLENEQLTNLIEFELCYFLFEKLRKRAAIYPPVTYSYAMTYGESHRDGNLSSSLRAFRKAARELHSQKIVSFDEANDHIRLMSDNFLKGLGPKLSLRALYTAKSLTQYAIHGYAGRVGLDIIGREVISKLSRSRRNYSLPEVIQFPKKFWTGSEGKLFADTENWYSDLLEHLGFHKSPTKMSQRSMGEFYNSTKAFTIDDGEQKLSFAVKRYRDVKSVKWFLVNLWSLKNTNFSMNPLERMTREYHALSEFRKFGIFTPSVIALFLSERMLVTEFISGRDLSEIEADYLEGKSEDLEPIIKYGEIIARIHNAGYCIGDSKPSNAILSDQNQILYLVDLEQSHQNGNLVWDIAEFIYYSSMFTLKEDRTKKIVDSFVRGYRQRAQDSGVIRKANGLRYRAPFQPFIAPNILIGLREYLAAS